MLNIVGTFKVAELRANVVAHAHAVCLYRPRRLRNPSVEQNQGVWRQLHHCSVPQRQRISAKVAWPDICQHVAWSIPRPGVAQAKHQPCRHHLRLFRDRLTVAVREFDYSVCTRRWQICAGGLYPVPEDMPLTLLPQGPRRGSVGRDLSIRTAAAYVLRRFRMYVTGLNYRTKAVARGQGRQPL